jgi:hypothetical protein
MKLFTARGVYLPKIRLGRNERTRWQVLAEHDVCTWERLARPTCQSKGVVDPRVHRHKWRNRTAQGSSRQIAAERAWRGAAFYRVIPLA